LPIGRSEEERKRGREEERKRGREEERKRGREEECLFLHEQGDVLGFM